VPLPALTLLDTVIYDKQTVTVYPFPNNLPWLMDRLSSQIQAPIPTIQGTIGGSWKARSLFQWFDDLDLHDDIGWVSAFHIPDLPTLHGTTLRQTFNRHAEANNIHIQVTGLDLDQTVTLSTFCLAELVADLGLTYTWEQDTLILEAGNP